MKKSIRLLLAIPFLVTGISAHAESYELTLKDNLFTPPSLTVPANKKVKLKIHNQDATPIEFESHDLGREKVIGAHRSATIFIGPLKAGDYTYFDEFHPNTPKGTITAK